MKPATTLLLILDGFGHRDNPAHNAIAMARMPAWHQLLSRFPHTLIHTSGMHVGLPDGQMGNSEVGHMNLGAGRVVYQSLTRINKAIVDGDFFTNPALCGAVDQALQHDSALHVLGLLSEGGIHSHEDQIMAMLQLAERKGCKRIYLHAMLDGRDTPPRSAEKPLRRFSDWFAQRRIGRIASVGGRYFGMDRDKRWDRVEKAFNAICHGKAAWQYSDALAALQAAYARGENDEFVQPAILCANGETPVTINDNDAIIYMNFRADRARQLTAAFLKPDFNGFERGALPKLSMFASLTEYAADLPTTIAFGPENLDNSLGEYLSKLGRTQLRIAETEKYAHVTFFFSGGREDEYPGENRILVPSPKVDTYDQQPEMSAFEVTDKLVTAIRNRDYDVIICNFANGDMVGHTGSLPAAIRAVEVLDQCIGRITDALLETGGQCLITADHGNCEEMVDESTGQPMTQHTTGPVPLVYVGPRKIALQDDGALSDVAPSLLALMNLPQPAEMLGHSLVQTS
ncbi:MAG TPA: 2,3-bisphosphoglycerate-independent phosphoglycerate mutase [Candidatus Acidoferrum sp.]|nr:2,3-bisphosphoglycerate-independent phosphoglycerate mutase [Candidatus Acidoferrum sp.]